MEIFVFPIAEWILIPQVSLYPFDPIYCLIHLVKLLCPNLIHLPAGTFGRRDVTVTQVMYVTMMYLATIDGPCVYIPCHEVY